MYVVQLTFKLSLKLCISSFGVFNATTYYELSELGQLSDPGQLSQLSQLGQPLPKLERRDSSTAWPEPGGPRLACGRRPAACMVRRAAMRARLSSMRCSGPLSATSPSRARPGTRRWMASPSWQVRRSAVP